MSDISKEIDKFLKENLADTLKKVGFKRKRRSWFRKREDRIEKISVEASTWNMGSEGVFWLYFSVYIHEIAKFFKKEIEGDEPKGFESGILKLLGQLMPEGKQDQWKVIVGADNSLQAQEFRNAVENYGLPWFDKIMSENGLIEFLKENNHWHVLAVIHHLRGQEKEKMMAINKMIEISGRPRDETVTWAKGLGLIES